MAETTDPEAPQLVRGILAALLQPLTIPMVLLEANGSIVLSNTAAEQLLAAGDLIGTCSGRLTFAAPATAEQVAGFVGDDDAKLLVLPIASAGDDAAAMTATLTRIDLAPAMITGLAAPLTLLHLAPAQSDPLAELELARTNFAFSDAEFGVVRAIVGGQSVGQHAAARGVSIHTARKQLTAAMRKAGVSRQSELAVLVHRGRSLEGPAAADDDLSG